MRSKPRNTKNSYVAKSLLGREVPQPSKDTLMLGHRATIYAHSKDARSCHTSHDEHSRNKRSNFEQLKNQIKHLENSQFLCLKYRFNTEPDCPEENTFYRLTGKEFMPSKKIAQIEKYKLHLRRKGKPRKVSLLMERFPAFPEDTREQNSLTFLEVKDVNRQRREGSCNLKKKETPGIVKKFYRPQTGYERSSSEAALRNHASNASVRGRALKSSACNRPQKENFLVYCY